MAVNTEKEILNTLNIFFIEQYFCDTIQYLALKVKYKLFIKCNPREEIMFCIHWFSIYK